MMPVPVAVNTATSPEQILVPEAIAAAGAAFTIAETGVRVEVQVPLFSET